MALIRQLRITNAACNTLAACSGSGSGKPVHKHATHLALLLPLLGRRRPRLLHRQLLLDLVVNAGLLGSSLVLACLLERACNRRQQGGAGGRAGEEAAASASLLLPAATLS